ncbi:hypothetical protein AGOR_G00138920 [Albula goreensis]|uniref:U1 small nuclear ribonucleoprotein C n=1 Tax=Albula goreensis TaxID=1534307 RepID=A0A8T3DB52_9TELE|nr:hypothetical protein AGOR_G00138920 [Albula goreensis]
MPKFYCDYCDTYLTHDSPSVRKTHCSGRKHKENVKDYYQKWMEEQAQSLIDKTTAAFQQGKIPPTPFPGAPPPGGAMIPPPPNISKCSTAGPGVCWFWSMWSSTPWNVTSAPYGWSSNDAHDGPPPPGMMPGGPETRKEQLIRIGPDCGIFPRFHLEPAPGMRPPMGGHMQMMPGPPMMRPPSRPMMVPLRPGMARPDR